MAESKLQRSEIFLEGGGSVVILPKPGRERIALTLDKAHVLTLSAEEAYSVGSSLVEHATECGYDPDTGETKLGRMKRTGITRSGEKWAIAEPWPE